MPISRRDTVNILKKLAVPSVLVGSLGMYGLDQYLFKGSFADIFTRAVFDRKYREKLLDEIKSGTATQHLQEKMFEHVIPKMENVSLGDPLDLQEPALNDFFTDKYDIREVHNDGEPSGKLLLVATVPPTVGIIQSATKKDAYFSTQKLSGGFFSIPSPNLDIKGEGESTPHLFSEYTVSDKIVHYGLESTDLSSGAMVVLPNNQLIIVDKSNLGDYSCGKNCLAVVGFPLAVSSLTLNHDLASIDSAQFKYNGITVDSPIFSNLTGTFTMPDGSTKTVMLSVYQHFNSDTVSGDGGKWLHGLSITQGVSLFSQLALENGATSFVFVPPDPHYMHSNYNGPSIFRDMSGNDWFRTLQHSGPPVISNENNQYTNFYPSIFLGIKRPASG